MVSFNFSFFITVDTGPLLPSFACSLVHVVRSQNERCKFPVKTFRELNFAKTVKIMCPENLALYGMYIAFRGAWMSSEVGLG